MPQLDLDGANSKISVDTIRGQSGTTVTVQSGHNLVGSGSGLTALPAGNLTGTVANANLASGIDAAKITTGTLPMARLSGTLPALNGSSLTNLPAPSSTIYDLHFTAGFDADATHMTKENATVGTYGEAIISRAGTFVGQAGYCDTFSGPGYTEVDILKNGTTIYSTRPSFGSSAMGTSPGPAYSVTSFAANDRITFRVHSNANGNSQGIRFTLMCTV